MARLLIPYFVFNLHSLERWLLGAVMSGERQSWRREIQRTLSSR